MLTRPIVSASGEPLELLGLAVHADDHAGGVDDPDAHGQVVQDRLDFQPLGLRLGLATLELVEQGPAERLAVLLELADRLGGRLVDHGVDGRDHRLDLVGPEVVDPGEVEGRDDQRRAEVAELGDDLGDVVPLAPAVLAVLLAGRAGVGLLAPEPVGQAVEELGDVVGELAVGQPFGVGDVAVPLDGLLPDAEDRFGLAVDVIRQQGGLAHGLAFARWGQRRCWMGLAAVAGPTLLLAGVKVW